MGARLHDLASRLRDCITQRKPHLLLDLRLGYIPETLSWRGRFTAIAFVEGFDGTGWGVLVERSLGALILLRIDTLLIDFLTEWRATCIW